MQSNEYQLDVNAAQSMFEKGSYGKGQLAIVLPNGQVPYVTTAYYAVAQNVEVEEIHLLVRQSQQTQNRRLPEFIQQGKLVFLTDINKGEANMVVASGTGALVTDPKKQRDLMSNYVQAIADEDIQQLSSEVDLPSDVYIIELHPSLLKFRKDTANQTELTAAFQAMAR